ncbi:MAG: hypothetical protein U5J63_16035 [Fodinibius sp.]|nr:hypothetical protein [Fodinibius sp.]
MPGLAQQQDTANVKLKETPMSVKLLPYSNPMISNDEDFAPQKLRQKQKLDDFQRDVMSRIADIYRSHVNAIEPLRCRLIR